MRTVHREGTLLVANDERGGNYFLARLVAGQLNVVICIGGERADDSVNDSGIGNGQVTNLMFDDIDFVDGQWHNVTVVQHQWKMYFYFDSSVRHKIVMNGTSNYFNFDPG